MDNFRYCPFEGSDVDVITKRNRNWKNAMTMVFVDTTEIKDWQSFHLIFSQVFGFPAFYGNNMDALIDCLSYLDEPQAEMTGVHVKQGETLAIQLSAVNSFRRRCPNQFEALQNACAFVNWRRAGEQRAPLVALSYYD